jgi:predicted peroxiredoxin
MAGEMLGIMITKHENPEHIAGVVKAARAAGHPVTVFMTDEGVKFTRDKAFLASLKLDGVEISVCDHSRERLGIREIIEGLSYGSQYNNAGMIHDCARVLIF